MRRFAMTRLASCPCGLPSCVGLLLGARTTALAQSTVLDDYVVFGDEKVTFGSRATVSDGDIGSNGAVVLGRETSAVPSVDVAADGAAPRECGRRSGRRLLQHAPCRERRPDRHAASRRADPDPLDPGVAAESGHGTVARRHRVDDGDARVVWLDRRLARGDPVAGARKLRRRYAPASWQRQGSDDAVVPGHRRRLHHLRRRARIARRQQHRHLRRTDHGRVHGIAER